MESPKFYLKQILNEGHLQCVRCCCYIYMKKLLISGGLDGKIIVWKILEPSSSSSMPTSSSNYIVSSQPSNQSKIKTVTIQSSNAYPNLTGTSTVKTEISSSNKTIEHLGPSSFSEKKEGCLNAGADEDGGISTATGVEEDRFASTSLHEEDNFHNLSKEFLDENNIQKDQNQSNQQSSRSSIQDSKEVQIDEKSIKQTNKISSSQNFLETETTNQKDTQKLTKNISNQSNTSDSNNFTNQNFETPFYFQKNTPSSFQIHNFFSPNPKAFPLTISESKFNSDIIYSGWNNGKVLCLRIEDGLIMNFFNGHNAPVNAIIEKNEDILITGSWDGTARIWSISSTLCKYVLEGHSHAVCLCLLQNDILLTSSQEPTITFWTNQEKKNQIKNAHTDIIRKIVKCKEGFISVSNDQNIKFWLLDGTQITQIHGHSSFIFDVCASKYNDDLFYTSSEDHTVKVWNINNFVNSQILTHPATVWQTIELLNGDIVTCCEDGSLYVWTRNESFALSPALREDFEKSLVEKDSSTVQGIDLEKLPDISEIERIVGKSNGQTKLFRENDKAIAFQWKGGKWERIGELVASKTAVHTQNIKQYYKGDNIFEEGEYDYIFDVEIGDKSGLKKLPYRNGQNFLLVAENFCARENLSKDNCEQIVSFIKENTDSNNIQEAYSRSTSQFDNKNNTNQLKSKHFPVMKYTHFDKVNITAIKEKITSINQSYEDIYEIKLNEKQIQNLIAVLDKIGSKEFKRKTFRNIEIEVIFKDLLHWPPEDSLPIVDIWRAMALHPEICDLFKGTDNGWQYLAFALKCFAQDMNGPLGICSLRFFVNLFEFSTLRISMLKWKEQILNIIVNSSDSSSKPIRLALANLLLNYSVAAVEKSDLKAKQQILQIWKQVLKFETITESFYKAIVSIGTLINLDIVTTEFCNDLQIFKDVNYEIFLEDKVLKEAFEDLQIFLEAD